MSILDSRLLGVACCIICYSHSQVVATNLVYEDNKKIGNQGIHIIKDGAPLQRGLRCKNSTGPESFYFGSNSSDKNDDDDGLIFHMDLDETPTNIASGDFGVQEKGK